jgi:tripartite-type tricarboxylate transporter receptor subunit TctC
MKLHLQFYSKDIRAILNNLMLITLVLGGASYAQDYPSKALRIVVPFPPGGSTDIAARIVGEKLSLITKQTVLIENRAGANGGIGAEIVARSSPDGYTILLGNLGIMAINPAIYERLSYDPRKQFLPVAMNVVSPLILIAHPSTGIHNVADLITRAKSEPGKLSFSSGGNGSAAHLAAELLNYSTGIQTLHVPYKGAAPATMAVATGEVMYGFSGQGPSWPLVKAGKLRALALSGPKRSVEHPDTAVVAEVVANFEVLDWNGMLLPVGTPTEIIQKLNQLINETLNDPDTRSKLQANGLDATPRTSEQFAVFIRGEQEKWAKVAKAAKVRAD